MSIEETEQKEENLLPKLCQPFLLNDASDICHRGLKLSVRGGAFMGFEAQAFQNAQGITYSAPVHTLYETQDPIGEDDK